MGVGHNGLHFTLNIVTTAFKHSPIYFLLVLDPVISQLRVKQFQWIDKDLPRVEGHGW